MNKRSGTLNRFPGIKTGLLSLLICLFFAGNIMAQKTEITGKVTDSSTGETLPGVSVKVAGTTTGTITDIDGKYKISIPSASARLEFSYVGYVAESSETKNRSVIDISLRADSKSLDEVVVIGYGTSKRKDLTGSVSSVSAEDLKNSPAATAAEAITGRIAGVQVSSTEGAVGADISIKVRGGSSITQSNAPLYIIDGFPNDLGLAAVNPTDILSIDVLKDASSTAIYGARGANGVVLITTKGGKKGRVNINYDGFYGVKWLSKKLDVLNPYEYVVYQYEAQNCYGDANATFKTQYGKWDDLYPTYSKDPGYDWQNLVLGEHAPNQTHNISINGGSDKTLFNVGYSYNNEDGIIVNTNYTRNLFKVKLDQIVNDKLKFSIASTYQERKVLGGGAYSSNGIYAKLPNIVMYRPTDGIAEVDLTTQDYDPVASGTNVLVNPLTMQYAQYRCNKYKNMQINGGLNYTIIPNLVLTINGGYSSDMGRIESFDDARTRDAINKGGPYGSLSYTESKRTNNQDYLNYTKAFGKHNVNVTVGYEQVYTYSSSLTASNSGYVSDNLGLDNMSLGSTAGNPTTSVSEDMTLSFFGRANYSYGNRYIASVSLRRDGSSRFGKENRFANFPAASVAWRISEESFLKSIDVISNLKLRFSYGQAGNNNIPNYLSANQIKFTGYGMNNSYQVGAYPSNLTNPNLKWETTTSRNLGLDWGFFKNRVAGTVELYRNTTDDLLLNATVPPNTGFSTAYMNIGKTENKGLELTINTVNVSTKAFQWRTDFNISFNRNKVLALTTSSNAEEMKQMSSWPPVWVYDFRVKVGKPVGLMYGYVYDGWYTADDFTGYDASTKKFTIKTTAINTPFIASPQPGDEKLKDITGDGKITTDDQRVIGDANPKHFGGINNTFNYKGFDLGIFMNWSYGNDIENANKARFTSIYAQNQNALGIMRQRYRLVDGDGNKITDLQRLNEVNKNAKVHKPNNDLSHISTWDIEDGSFLRINNITLGYTFNKKLLAKFNINSLRVYATLYNIYTFTKYSGYDPEVNAMRSTNLTPGVDYSALPRNKQIIFGVNLTL